MSRIISPSMLSADFGHLDRDTRMIDQSQAAWVHIDVMDGVFVPNISFGFPVLKAIRKATDKFLDVHLMIVEPQRYVEQFVKDGADLVTVHIEAVDDVKACIEMIHAAGAKAGVSIKPKTPVSTIVDILPMLDLVLVMSVEPGFGGQSFIEGSFDKVRQLRRLIDDQKLDCVIEIDGGVSNSNAGALFDAGCDVLVAGSAVFKAEDPKQEIVRMLNAK